MPGRNQLTSRSNRRDLWTKFDQLRAALAALEREDPDVANTLYDGCGQIVDQLTFATMQYQRSA